MRFRRGRINRRRRGSYGRRRMSRRRRSGGGRLRVGFRM